MVLLLPFLGSSVYRPCCSCLLGFVTLFLVPWAMMGQESPRAGEGTLASEEPPNIVVLFADDLGWRDLSCMGSRYYETPAIDGLAREGLLFSDAYASAPVCLPARAGLLTGKAPARLHMTAVFDRDGGEMPLLPPQWRNQLPLEERTLPERLQERGYLTAIIGKWHLGKEDPRRHGFDVNVAAWQSGRPATYFSPYQNPAIEDGPDGEYLTDRLGEEAATFISENADRPFFLYLPFYSPHAPLEAPQGTIDRFATKEPDGAQKWPTYAAMIAHLDAAVGRVLTAIDDAGLRERTIVVFTSDNGGVLTLGDLAITDNSPLRGEKFQLYEGGIRVPLLVRWPGVVPAGATTRQLAVTHDLMPTLLAAVGAATEDPDWDGIDLGPVLRRGDEALIERDLAWHYPHYMPRQSMKPCSALRSGDYKLIHWWEDHRLELYDLSSDIGETHDLAATQPERALSLYDKLSAWRHQVGAQSPRPNPQRN